MTAKKDVQVNKMTTTSTTRMKTRMIGEQISGVHSSITSLPVSRSFLPSHLKQHTIATTLPIGLEYHR